MDVRRNISKRNLHLPLALRYLPLSHMPMHSFTQRRILTILIGLFAAPLAMAQTGPDLLLKPWPKDRKVEVQADATFFDTGHTSTGDSFHLTQYGTSGRA